MVRTVTKLGREGFTLIEVLVTLILLAVLVAAVFPVVTQQSEQGDPVRVGNDLASIRTAVGQFRLNMRPDYPGDLEDLVYSPSTGAGDVNVTTTAYANEDEWNGPYIDLGIAEAGVATDSVSTAFGGRFANDFKCLGSGSTVAEIANASCAKGDFIAVRIDGIADGSESDLLEEQIDGNDTADQAGKFRHDGVSTAYYIVGPYF